jgi:hypothetical protein
MKSSNALDLITMLPLMAVGRAATSAEPSVRIPRRRVGGRQYSEALQEFRSASFPASASFPTADDRR